MKTFDFLKTVFNLHGKKISWGVIEVLTSTKCEYHAGLIIKGSNLFVDLCERRFYSPVSLPELSRQIYPARRVPCGNKVTFEVVDNSFKHVTLSKNFIRDIYGVAWYTPELENEYIL